MPSAGSAGVGFSDSSNDHCAWDNLPFLANESRNDLVLDFIRDGEARVRIVDHLIGVEEHHRDDTSFARVSQRQIGGLSSTQSTNWLLSILTVDSGPVGQ